MNFPAYTPPAVQQYITALLYDANGTRGWVAAAKEPGNKWIAEIVAFLQRFEKPDEEIQEMFRHLDDANLSEADQRNFMNAAWSSLTDFVKYRNIVKETSKLNKDIATKAKELATLLNQIQGHGLSGLPMTFYDVRTLLHETDNQRDWTWWKANRDKLVGESAGEDVRYAWSAAPSLSELLGTVAEAASDYSPCFNGRIGAAIRPSLHNRKTEFIRAFADGLDDAGIPMTTSEVINAIAGMTTVAINDGTTIASRDDVKQALGLKKKKKPAG